VLYHNHTKGGTEIKLSGINKEAKTKFGPSSITKKRQKYNTVESENDIKI